MEFVLLWSEASGKKAIHSISVYEHNDIGLRAQKAEEASHNASTHIP